jgi:hypothetical protein
MLLMPLSERVKGLDPLEMRCASDLPNCCYLLLKMGSYNGTCEVYQGVKLSSIRYWERPQSALGRPQ